jgi:hypothetical protein
MRVFVVLLATASLVAGCRRPSLPALSPPGPVPAALDRPAGGWVCTRQVPITASPDALFREARLAVARLGLRPALLDSTRRRVTIAGDLAPAGRGTAGQQAVRLYFDWQVITPADSSAAYVIHLAPGLWTRPVGLTRAEHRELALQAGALAGRFVRALPSAPEFGFICNADEAKF